MYQEILAVNFAAILKRARLVGWGPTRAAGYSPTQILHWNLYEKQSSLKLHETLDVSKSTAEVQGGKTNLLLSVSYRTIHASTKYMCWLFQEVLFKVQHALIQNRKKHGGRTQKAIFEEF